MEISASSTDSRDGSDNSEEMRRHHHHHHHHHHVEEKAAIEIDVNKLNGEDAAAVEIGVMASQKSEEFFTLDQEGQRKFLHDLFTGLSQQEHNKPLVEGIFEQAKRGTERKRKGDDDPCSDDEGGLEVPGKKRQKEAVVQPVLKELEDGKEAEGKGKRDRWARFLHLVQQQVRLHSKPQHQQCEERCPLDCKGVKDPRKTHFSMDQKIWMTLGREKIPSAFWELALECGESYVREKLLEIESRVFPEL